MEGYRLIDIAAAYLKEEAVGKAIKRSGVPREELLQCSPRSKYTEACLNE
ncbi:diketogulonate reductase-like aldo/keto reductase [Anaerosolibacter carboniphilus]|uniref:Diketogulonate reductase-like aldo/keto reductase n=1 Tax=Anaerosolibacter carboniphilus TaxID=1417629 RepID=A0A841KY22_9FIRM|nr:diketogulonate reductase-like aldo/keto reductase [Anaerosolibacter carboniphilus]